MEEHVGLLCSCAARFFVFASNSMLQKKKMVMAGKCKENKRVEVYNWSDIYDDADYFVMGVGAPFKPI